MRRYPRIFTKLRDFIHFFSGPLFRDYFSALHLSLLILPVDCCGHYGDCTLYCVVIYPDMQHFFYMHSSVKLTSCILLFFSVLETTTANVL